MIGLLTRSFSAFQMNSSTSRFSQPGPPSAIHADQALDHSLHLVLPIPAAEAAIEAGWAEQHLIARRIIFVRASYASATRTQPALSAPDHPAH